MDNKIKIGLFGFGCVGQGLYDVLENSKGFKADIKTIAVKDPNKERSLPAERFTFDKHDILTDDEVDLVVELIDDADEAYYIVTEALKSGKNVVSANKKLIAEHFEELVRIQQEHDVSLLYEASSCGSIPIIRNLEEYYDNELLNGVSGIFNGSSNYILTKVIQDGLDYQTALKEAQDLGFAETDPTLDVGGFDAKYKLVIITGHSYGVFVKPSEVLNVGIENLTQEDIDFAKARGYKIKQVARVQKVNDHQITLFVLPQFIGPEHQLYNVDYEYNAVTVEAAFSESQLFIGKGAGGYPTGSAVLSDISANSYDYGYEYKKYNQNNDYSYTTEVLVEVYVRAEDPELLASLPLKEVAGLGKNYVTGTIKLTDLIANEEPLKEAGAFIASTGVIQPITPKPFRRKQAVVSV